MKVKMSDRCRSPLTWLTVVFLLLCSVPRPAPAMAADDQQEVTRLAELLHWTAGTVVADIGAGDGRYTFAAAQIVGPSGRIYATEIDQQKLKSLREEVQRRKLENVIVVDGTADDTKLPSDCCDTILLRRVYHHLTRPRDFDKNLVRSLKISGHLAIIDFPPDPNFAPVEGVPENRGGHGIPRKIMIEELTSAGLHLEKTIDHWSGHDYCALFSKPNP